MKVGGLADWGQRRLSRLNSKISDGLFISGDWRVSKMTVDFSIVTCTLHITKEKKDTFHTLLANNTKFMGYMGEISLNID